MIVLQFCGIFAVVWNYITYGTFSRLRFNMHQYSNQELAWKLHVSAFKAWNYAFFEKKYLRALESLSERGYGLFTCGSKRQLLGYVY